MDRKSLELLIDGRIEVLKIQKDDHLRAAHDCDVKIKELEFMLKEVNIQDKLLTDQHIKSQIKVQVSRGTKPPLILDEKQNRKANLFLEYIEKFDDKRVSTDKMKKEIPKLHYYLYNKTAKLWNDIEEFRRDLNDWLNRRGPWEGILDKKEDK